MLRSRLRDAARLLYERAPASRKALHVANNLLHPPTFSGWGMTTQHAPAWDDAHDWQHFRDALAYVETDFEHGLREDTGVSSATVHTLSWRHWFVSFAARYACLHAEEPEVALVECGVGDGLTAFFACNEATQLGAEYVLHCYDTWSQVSVDDGKRDYASLNLERTQRNLSRFASRTRYHVGMIPRTLDTASAPDVVHYLSLDLNAAAPTLAALDFFLPRLAARGIILFDDYGYIGYEQTKAAVDSYFAGRPGVLLKLPTGQAAWLN